MMAKGVTRAQRPKIARGRSAFRTAWLTSPPAPLSANGEGELVDRDSDRLGTAREDLPPSTSAPLSLRLRGAKGLGVSGATVKRMLKHSPSPIANKLLMAAMQGNSSRPCEA